MYNKFKEATENLNYVQRFVRFILDVYDRECFIVVHRTPSDKGKAKVNKLGTVSETC
jgi:hypothetical protein